LTGAVHTSKQELEIPAGAKYALLCLSTDATVDDLPEEIVLRGRYRFSRGLPIELPKHWCDWLGELRVEDLREADLVLAAVLPADQPEVLDRGNREVSDELRRFYLGLLMGTKFLRHTRATVLTGGNAGLGPNIKQAFSYEPVFSAAGCPQPTVDAESLKRAERIADGIQALRETDEFDRTWRLAEAYLEGKRATNVSESLHQHVRCVEGLVLPEIGKTTKQFEHRTQLFVGARHRRRLGLLFAVRSAVEHLNYPLDPIESETWRERTVELYRCAAQAEALAQYCVERLFTRKELRDHFRSDKALRAFWSLEASEQRDIWGEPMDFDAVLNGFDERKVRPVAREPE